MFRSQGKSFDLIENKIPVGQEINRRLHYDDIARVNVRGRKAAGASDV